MAQEGFKHISVTPPDEDDFVINAGIVKDSAFDSRADEADIVAYESTDVEPPDIPQGSDDNKGDVLGGDRRAGEPTAESAKGKKAEQAAKRRGADGEEFQETTLQDLRGEPMPFTQKVVIIAAVVCIIGALAYYFICMS